MCNLSNDIFPEKIYIFIKEWVFLKWEPLLDVEHPIMTEAHVIYFYISL